MVSLASNLFFSKDGIISGAHFAADLLKFRSHLSGAKFVCNLQHDRYHFSLGLASAILDRQISVLPPSDAPEAVVASIGAVDDAVILGGSPSHDGIARRIPVIETAEAETGASDIFTALENAPGEIRVFSSGSTKQPEVNVKTWQILKGGAAVTDIILRQIGVNAQNTALLGTTPHGHMFGLEATIFAALGFGYCCYRDTVFYPADLEIAVNAARSAGFANIVLVTSPAHLKFLETTIRETPEICCVISATAPLPRVQATRLEARGDIQVIEIYGSTETGSMAIRRTSVEETWKPVAGFELSADTDTCLASAPHLPAPVSLSDDVKIEPDGRFTLLGRTGDMVSIRGKRSRISALNSVLIEAPGILDAVFLHSKRRDNDVLGMIIVPDRSAGQTDKDLKAAVRRHLLRYVDAVFVPKKIVFLDALPRTDTGKLTSKSLGELASLAGISDNI